MIRPSQFISSSRSSASRGSAGRTIVVAMSVLALGACATQPSRVGQIKRLSPAESAALPVAPVYAPAPAAAPPAYAPAPAQPSAVAALTGQPSNAPPSAVSALTGQPSAPPPVMRASAPGQYAPQAQAAGPTPTPQQIARDQQISAQVLRDQAAADQYEAQRQADLARAREYSYYATPYFAPYYAAPYYSPFYSPFNYGSVYFGGGGRGRSRWGGSIGFGGW